MEFPLTDYKQLHDRVADCLRDMIIQGKLKAGEWLRQERLAAELGISYTPIREALKQLEVEGLVEHAPYRGVRVVQFGVDDVVDIYSLRSVLEGQASAAAALRLTDAELGQLRALHEGMLALTGKDDLQQFRDLNRQFHQAISQASQRTYLIRALKSIWLWSPTMLWNQLVAPDSDLGTQRRAHDNVEHQAVLEALEAHLPQAAESAMRYHIDQAQQALVDHLKSQQV